MATARREALTNLGLFILRASFGLQLALLHGLDKLQNFSQRAGTFPNPIGLGPKYSLIGVIGAELVCGLLLAVGLASRVAALGIAFALGVAAFVQHGGDPWKRKELALLYFTAGLAFALTGPGRFSLDAVVARRGGGGKGPARAAFKKKG